MQINAGTGSLQGSLFFLDYYGGARMTVRRTVGLLDTIPYYSTEHSTYSTHVFWLPGDIGVMMDYLLTPARRL